MLFQFFTTVSRELMEMVLPKPWGSWSRDMNVMISIFAYDYHWITEIISLHKENISKYKQKGTRKTTTFTKTLMQQLWARGWAKWALLVVGTFCVSHGHLRMLPKRQGLWPEPTIILFFRKIICKPHLRSLVKDNS